MANAKHNGTATEKPLINNDSSCKKASCQNGSHSSWNGVVKKLRLLWPHVWPKDDRRLQCNFITSFLVMGLIRGVSLLIPIFYKLIVDSFSQQSQPVISNEEERNTVITISPTKPSISDSSQSSPDLPFRWDYIVLYVVLMSMKGPGGYLTAVRNVLWLKVQQYAARNLRIALFEHLHNLSLRWHVNRKMGEVLQVMDRGVHGVTQILSIACSQLLPVIADILIAIMYFFVAFDPWIGFIILVTMVVYGVAAVILSEWRVKYRRQLNLMDNEKTAAAVDSILNFETVKLFAAEKWEVNKYADAVYEHQNAEWLVHASANLYGSVRVTIMNIGFLAGSLLTAYYVSSGRFTAGDYVMYASYVMQLYEPLNMLGAYYRLLQQSFIDMEHMFEMFDEKPDITDAEDASHLLVTRGNVEFKNVSFSYMEGYQVLKNISFAVPPGKTVAIVGESGGGKSTVVKLLFRLYDIDSGTIRIDGQDIAKATQDSLRKALGVVPQETALFHADVGYNIRYGSPQATDEDMKDAARAADIHDMIMSLPEGYSSRIGERGLKLSGGERQRVAIARTIVKEAKIIVLDEATSALDSKTERNIQKSLSEFGEARTCLIIAHRLSTIVNADEILVLKNGRIVERGKHSVLLSYGGVYAGMWLEQLQTSDRPCKCRSLPAFTKPCASTSTPQSLRHTIALSMTSSAISEESNEPNTSVSNTGYDDVRDPLNDIIIADDYNDYQDGASLKIAATTLPVVSVVWPRRMSKSLVNLNPHETDTSRLQQSNNDTDRDRRRKHRLEHSISLCDAFNVTWESETDIRKQRPPNNESPWQLKTQRSLDETPL